MSDWLPLIGQRAGKQTDVKFDSDGRIIIRTAQECEGILDINKERRNHGSFSAADMGGLGRHVATIPNAILAKWLLEDGIDVWSGEHQDGLARKLNDPDNAYLRTSGGHIGVSNGVAR